MYLHIFIYGSKLKADASQICISNNHTLRDASTRQASK